MRFRTEIDIQPSQPIGPDDRLVMLGSCFADNMGARLGASGFDVLRNPLGPLFNPASLAAAVERALTGRGFDVTNDLVCHDGQWHCLDAAARYQSENAEALVGALNRDFRPLGLALGQGNCTLFATFGTAYIYNYRRTSHTVANCHRLPAAEFDRRRMSVEEIVNIWQPLLRELSKRNIRTIFTVSPVRHTADGLHGNNLSKATLLLAIDQLKAEYFPAYEIVCDDLRDYRFYATDMKHPSEDAIEYIYEKFAETYFSRTTQETAARRLARTKSENHRQQPPII